MKRVIDPNLCNDLRFAAENAWQIITDELKQTDPNSDSHLGVKLIQQTYGIDFFQPLSQFVNNFKYEETDYHWTVSVHPLVKFYLLVARSSNEYYCFNIRIGKPLPLSESILINCDCDSRQPLREMVESYRRKLKHFGIDFKYKIHQIIN